MSYIARTNEDCVRKYADILRGQREYHTQGYRLYTCGDVLYSYGPHYPIAVLIGGDNGVRFLFASKKSTPTTERQKKIARRILTQTFGEGCIVECPMPTSGTDANFLAFVSQLQPIEEKLRKARKPELYLPRIAEIVTQVYRYAKVMGVSVPAPLSNYELR